MTASLRLELIDGQQVEAVDGVLSLRAGDASGQFGILPGHDDFLTVLEPGLFRYRTREGDDWTYGACPGGLLRCERTPAGTRVRIVSSRFLREARPQDLVARLDDWLAHEGAVRVSTRESRERMDLALMRALQDLARTAP